MVDLSAAIQLAPRNPIPYFNRGEVFSRIGLRDRALQDYNEAIRIDPRIAAAYAASGRLREENGERDQAIRDYDMAVQLNPKEVSLYNDRGNVRRQRSDWLGALADYDRAVMLDPKRAETYVARGWSRLSAGVEGADYDARAYLALKGWHDGLAPYMAVLAVLAHARLDALPTRRARSTKASPTSHPAHGRSPSCGTSRAKSTRVPCSSPPSATGSRPRSTPSSAWTACEPVTGQEALTQLHWVKDHGQPGSIAADVAEARLSRLEPNAK